MADNKVMFEGILLKPAMVTPGGFSLVFVGVSRGLFVGSHANSMTPASC
jgi:hypothetical protein